jgi:flavin reductase (DIM6/NTAB) family NADH-FMN oxidoreductase RutF
MARDFHRRQKKLLKNYIEKEPEMSKTSIGPKTLVFPTPAWAVATYDADGKANAMVVAWGGICCSKPPCVAVSLREATHSYAAITERGAFTVNIPSADYVSQLDFLGINSGRKIDKFTATGLTPVKSELVDAPLIDEFPLNLECKVIHKVEIGLHTQFIGEIVDVKVDESVLTEDGGIDLSELRPFTYAPEVREYRILGDSLGKAFSIGKEISQAQ